MQEKDARLVTPLAAQDWPPTLDEIKTDMQGAPINVHKLMAHSPDLLRAWWNFRNYAVNGGSLGPMLGEIVILRVAVHLGAWYEWGAHVDRALRLEMPRATLHEVLKPQPNLPPEILHICVAVDELMRERGVRPATRAALEQSLTTAQIMDLIAIQGMYVLLGGFIKTWDLALDTDVAARIADVTNREDFEAAARAFQEAI